MRAFPVLALMASALLLAPAVQAENSQDFGNTVVHFNAFSSTILSPQVAKAYGITRSGSRALVNIAVLGKKMETTGVPQASKVEGTGTNLNGQVKNLTFREIREDGAIYYLSELRVNNEDTIRFDIRVTPDGASEPLVVKFNKQFFVD